MKKIILSICSLAILSLTYNSCKKDDVQPNKKEGTVEFGFSLKTPSHSSAQKSSIKAVAEPMAVIVSVKKANGSLAYSMEKVELYNMNGYYISKPLSLVPGNYTIEQFLVVDASNNVIYASPLQGSSKAYLVSQPLPISFTISKDNVTKVVPEVLSAEGLTPEDFGYSTFSFNVVKTFDFLMGVFIYNESITNFEMTTASLNIVAGGKTIYSGTLAAITNTITVKDDYSSYILTITKDGYKTWTGTFTAAELKLYFRSEDKGPLEVILEKGAVITQIKYGRLYNWYAAVDTRNIANTGWNVPTLAQMTILQQYLGGESLAGDKLRETGLDYWSSPNIATNSSSFNGRGAGERSINGNFSNLRAILFIITLEIPYPDSHIPGDLRSGGFTLYGWSSGNNKVGQSIRLIKASTTLTNGQAGTYLGNDGKIYRTICIGTQEWLADNLAETKYRNGDPIPEVTDNTAWSVLTTGAWCAYDNDHSNI